MMLYDTVHNKLIAIAVHFVSREFFLVVERCTPECHDVECKYKIIGEKFMHKSLHLINFRS